MTRFDICNETLELQKAIGEFNMWMEELVHDDELVSIHGKMAKKIDKFAGHMYDDI